MEPPLLDQVSSQALTRLAAEHWLAATVVPAGDEAVRVRGSGWKRWLPYFFFALSLFALGSMALGISAIAEDGWSWTAATQLALMALLVMGVVTQARTMLRPTRAARWFGARRSAAGKASGPALMPAGFALDAVSAEYLTALRPASAAAMKRRIALRNAGSRWFERVSVVAVVVLAVGAFLGMLFVLGWVVYAGGVGDPSVWLTAPFTALTGFATWQVFGSARRMSFRGRPFALVSRTFRDSVRLWGSGSVATKVALTTTATASVAGAAVVPALVQRDTDLDIFLIDQGSNAVYRIDLATDISRRAQVRDIEVVDTIAFATNTTPVTLSGQRKLPKGSLVAVLEGSAGGQAIIAFVPGAQTPAQVSRIQPAIPDASFTGGPGVLFAIQPDGAFWRTDMRTGAATRVGEVAVPPGPITYEADSKSIVMVSGDQVVRIDPASGAVLASGANLLGPDERVCGIADGPGDRIFITIEGQPEIRVLGTKSGPLATIRPTGEFAAAPCQLAVAHRK